MSRPVNFADPTFEPTDEELQRLAREAFADAAQRRNAAMARFWAHVDALRAEVLERLNAARAKPSSG
jgi:hypothetical protein